MRKSAAILGITLMMLLGFGVSATAQTGAGDATGYERTTDDDGPDLGWLGLLGLAGLLGLKRREAHRDVGRTATTAPMR